MARDSVTVDFLLNTRKADKDLARIRREMERLGTVTSKAFKGIGGAGGGDKIRALGTGLSKATVRADEFTKSLEASNARVVAFGASAGIIMQIDRAFKGLVTSTMKVEKALLDVNVVLNASQKNLKKFGEEMFRVAKNTAQGFDVVAEASTELARQGLGATKTIERTNDALILTRLTGMQAADSVKALTAAVNSFNKEGVTSAQVINKMAKVDAAFAVSSEDLAKAISRVGASAVSAGVSMDELLAITTAVQQRTARGGAVIGNAFKTIFTRIQRTDVLQKLRNIGVAVTDMEGNMLSGIQVITNLAQKFDTLSKSQQSAVSESVAGVFQVNILKAAMADLASQTSVTSRALKISSQATNEAYKRNEELNKSLDALVNRTMSNLTQAGSSLGGGILEPAIRRTLNIVNATIESFGKGGMMENVGQGFGKSIMKGLGDFVAGPGLILLTATIAKLFYNLTKFTGKAFQDIMGINKATQQRAALEEAVAKTIASEPALLQSVLNKETSILAVERDILATIKRQNLERAAASTMAGPIAGSLLSRGARISRTGGVTMGRADGFIPNFANPNSERAAAAAGGYRAGAIRTMQQPGAGTVMYNTAETVKRFPGMSQSAIMPPKGSMAGANYRSAFGAAHGFDPYAAGGYVPNFARRTKSVVRERRAVDASLDATGDMGVIMAQAGSSSPLKFSNSLEDIPGLQKELLTSSKYKQLVLGDKQGRALDFKKSKLRIWGMPQVSMFPMTESEAAAHAAGQDPSTIKILQGSLDRYKDQVSARLFGGAVQDTDAFNIKRLSKGTAGDIFEEAVRASLKDADLMDRRAAFDFSGERYAPEGLLAFMRKEGANIAPKKSKVEAKIGKEAAVDGNLPKKVFNDAASKTGEKLGITKMAIFKELAREGNFQLAAGGFIPNFSLVKAISRETSAGVPASAVRVGSHPSLRNSGNPAGLGVYNTIHEPGGLKQGISRARSMGVNPQTHGVPNFLKVTPGSGAGVAITRTEIRNAEIKEKLVKEEISVGKEKLKTEKEGIKASKELVKSNKLASSSMRGVGISMAASLAGGTLRGAGVGTQGGISGAALGALEMGASMGGTGMMFGPKVGAIMGIGGAIYGGIQGFGGFEAAADSIEKLNEKMDELAKRNDRVSETFERIAAEIDKINQVGGGKRFSKIEGQRNTLSAFVKEEYGDEELYSKVFKNIRKAKTGADIRNIMQEAGSIYQADLASREMQKGVLGAEIELVKSTRNIQGFGYNPPLPGTGMRNTQFGPVLRSRGSFPLMRGAIQSKAKATIEARKRGSIKGIASVLGEGDFRRSGVSVIEEIADFALNSSTEDFRGRSIPITRFNEDASRGALAARRGKLRTALDSRPASAKDLAASIAGQTNLDQAGRKQLADDLVKRAEEAANKDETKRFTALEALQELGEEFLKTQLSGEKLTEEQMERARIESERVEKIKEEIRRQDERVAAFQAEISALDKLKKETIAAAGALKHNNAMTRAQTAYNNRLTALKGQGRVSFARATGDPRDVAQAVRDAAQASESVRYKGARTDADANFKKAVGDLQLAAVNKSIESIFKDALGGSVGLSAEVIKERSDEVKKVLDAIKGVTGKDIGKITPEDITNFEETLKNLGGLAAGEGGARAIKLSKAQTDELERLQGFLNTFRGLNIDFENQKIQLKDQNTKNKSLIEEKFKLDQQEIKNRFEHNKKMRDFNDEVEMVLSELRSREVSSRMSSGKITGAQGAALFKDRMERRRNFRGLGPMATEVNESMMVGFRGEMTYNARSYLNELEDGSRQLASTMKTSFADAFKNIASGASDARSAIAQFADSILNTISDVSARMGTNMLFSRMGFSQGGSIPGYNKGGIVTGGSGYKDDVLTMMNGGEFVIKKSSAQKIGYGTLNAINSGAVPGYNMGGMFALSAGASALSGLINNSGQSQDDPFRGQNYGHGRGEHGYFGGPDVNATGASSMTGNSQSAAISLSKGFNFYRRDPATGRLVSERARPTEGSYNVSSALSLAGRLREDDPQTARMFQREQTMGSYQDYLATETERRKDVMKAHERKKRGRLISAYANAAMLIGGSYLMGRTNPAQGQVGDPASPVSVGPLSSAEMEMVSGYPEGQGPTFTKRAGGGATGSSPALLTGGEYVMSADTVRTHGLGFMNELNRGNVPGYANGGFVGGGGAFGAGVNNNVSISVNVDKRGNASVNSSQDSSNAMSENATQEAEKNKQLGTALQTVVLQEIIKQQRPGGLLQNTSKFGAV